MSWQGIVGHDDVVDAFRRRLAAGRLASTFLFVGPAGVGKRTFALKLAQTLLCGVQDERELNPCGRCENCVQVAAHTHPDLLQVSKPADKSDIPVALLIGEKERRMQSGLCHDLWLRPVVGRRRVAILDDADDLNEAGANCLLKTLEEPPPASVLILIGTSLERQLPTIRSRAQIVRFRPLPLDAVAQLLVAQQIVPSTEEAERLAVHSGGSLARAVELADPELWVFRGTLLRQLANSPVDPLTLARSITEFVEGAGKEPARRRLRLRQVLDLSLEYYRAMHRALGGISDRLDPELAPILERVLGGARGEDARVQPCIERTLAALEQVDRFVNPTSLIEGWCDRLAALTKPA